LITRNLKIVDITLPTEDKLFWISGKRRKQNFVEIGLWGFACDSEESSNKSPTIQLSRAPRTALGSNQHDIAQERLKVDKFLAATKRFAGNTKTIQNQYRRFIKPALHVLRFWRHERSCAVYRPTVENWKLQNCHGYSWQITSRYLRWLTSISQRT
jgi:hypothetical protein